MKIAKNEFVGVRLFGSEQTRAPSVEVELVAAAEFAASGLLPIRQGRVAGYAVLAQRGNGIGGSDSDELGDVSV